MATRTRSITRRILVVLLIASGTAFMAGLAAVFLLWGLNRNPDSLGAGGPPPWLNFTTLSALGTIAGLVKIVLGRIPEGPQKQAVGSVEAPPHPDGRPALHADDAHPVDEVTILRAPRDLSSARAAPFLELLEQPLEAGAFRLAVDMEAVVKLEDASLGALLVALRRATDAGGGIRLFAVPHPAAELVSTMGLDTVFRTYETEEEAIASWSDPHPIDASAHSGSLPDAKPQA